MGYFGEIAASYFKKAKDGKEIFYPWGIAGKGYILPSEEKTLKLKKTFRNAGILSLLLAYLALFLGKFLGLHAAVGLILLYGFGYYIFIQTLTRGFEISDERLTFVESLSSRAKHFSYFDLIAMSVGCLIFVFAGIWIIIKDKGFLKGIAGIIFFGACFIAVAKMFYKKWNSIE